MTFSNAAAEMEPALRALWQRVFGDSSEYLDLFFHNCFDPAETMTASEEGVPLSVLYLLPMTVCAGEKEYDARYVYAVATAPEARSKGLSGRLLFETHRVLKERGISLSLLVPAEESLFGYYAARGYETSFYRREIVWHRTQGPTVPLCSASLPQLKQLRDSFFGRAGLFGMYDEKALLYREKENRFLKGETLSFSLDGVPGYAVCTPAEDFVLIRELAAPCDERVLRSAALYFKKNSVRVCLDGEIGDIPMAMTCWYVKKPDEKGKTSLSLVLD